MKQLYKETKKPEIKLMETKPFAIQETHVKQPCCTPFEVTYSNDIFDQASLCFRSPPNDEYFNDNKENVYPLLMSDKK